MANGTQVNMTLVSLGELDGAENPISDGPDSPKSVSLARGIQIFQRGTGRVKTFFRNHSQKKRQEVWIGVNRTVRARSYGLELHEQGWRLRLRNSMMLLAASGDHAPK